MQREYFGAGEIKRLSEIVNETNPKKIFIVCGKISYSSSGAKDYVEQIIKEHEIYLFRVPGTSPDIQLIDRGIMEFKVFDPDIVFGIGGGSCIDTAKAINILTANEPSAEEIIKGNLTLAQKGKPLVAIPTTSGTGSEATHFATIYIDKLKYSLAHSSMLPDFSIIDPMLTNSLSPYQTACTGMDALCQGIESFWSNSATEESMNFAEQAIKLSYSDLELAVNSPNPEARENMAKAANLSGKAINISKTTGAHSISYPITSHFSVPHGHAVAITLPALLNLNYSMTEENVLHPKGIEWIRSTIDKILKIFNSSTPEEFGVRFSKLMERIELKTALSELGIQNEDLEIILTEGFNPDRIGNNPRKLTKDELENLLFEIW